MDLISSGDRAIYSSGMDDVHDTFARDIVLVNNITTPKDSVDQEDDNYDFINDKEPSEDKFTFSSTRTTIKARVKYIDKQDKEYAFISTLGGEQINLALEFGLIRIKVKNTDVAAISAASSIEVDGNNTNVVFRDRPHGLFDINYATFYLQRTP